MRKAGMRGRAWMAAMALWLALSSVWPAMAVSIDLSVPETAESSGFSLEVIAAAKTTQSARRVFIYHTHTYEAYEMDADNRYTPTETWRTADENYNMIRVGEELARWLRGEFGVPILPRREGGQAALCFHPDGARGEEPTLELYGHAPDLAGLSLSAPHLGEGDREDLDLLAALYEFGRLNKEELKIT